MNVGLDPNLLTLLCKAFLWGFQNSTSKHSTGQNSPHFFSSFVPETLHQSKNCYYCWKPTCSKHRPSQSCKLSNDNESFREVCWWTLKSVLHSWGRTLPSRAAFFTMFLKPFFTSWEKEISVSLLLRLPLASFLPESSRYPPHQHTPFTTSNFVTYKRDLEQRILLPLPFLQAPTEWNLKHISQISFPSLKASPRPGFSNGPGWSLQYLIQSAIKCPPAKSRV